MHIKNKRLTNVLINGGAQSGQPQASQAGADHMQLTGKHVINYTNRASNKAVINTLTCR